jgi:hypothetical protein
MSKLSENIAEAVMKNLRRRKGILDGIEPDIQDEIKRDLNVDIQIEIDNIVEGRTE